MSKSTVASANAQNSIHFVDANVESETMTFGQLFSGNSKFTTGREFEITDVVAKFVVQSEDDVPSPTAKRHILLVTNIDDANGLNGKAIIWFTSRYRDEPNAIDINGNYVVPDGTFDAEMLDFVKQNSDKSLSKAIDALRDIVKGAKIRVRRKAYQGLYYGRPRTMTIPVFDRI